MASPDDVDELGRFIEAQDRVYDRVREELAAGQKRSHWMWFIFPQIKGLGSSSMAQRYAISSLDEANAYLNHELLGARLRECTSLVLGVEGKSLREIFGTPDDLKLRSSMTLFSHIAPDGLFLEVIDRFCEGRPDPRTLDLIGDDELTS